MESIVDILAQGRDREAQASKIHGFVVGLVTNITDPDRLGRIKVKFPWLSDDVESWWARVVQPMAGPSRGHWFIPEVDDEVLVGFEHGDVRFPYVIGSLYNGVDKPPEPKEITSTFAGTGYDHGAYNPTDIQDGKNDLRFFQSRSGHMIVFDDKAGAEKITVADKTGAHRLEIFTDKKKIVITSADGDIELIAEKQVLIRCEELRTETRKDTIMEVDGDMSITVKGKQTSTVTGKITRESKDSIADTASMNIDAKATQNITLTASMNLTAKGNLNLTAEAGVQATFKGGAMAILQGAMVKIN